VKANCRFNARKAPLGAASHDEILFATDDQTKHAQVELDDRRSLSMEKSFFIYQRSRARRSKSPKGGTQNEGLRMTCDMDLSPDGCLCWLITNKGDVRPICQIAFAASGGGALGGGL